MNSRAPRKPMRMSPMARRAAISSTLGSALEWIDFTAYGAVAATVLPTQFFPTMDPSTAILASFATFGVGFFARPAGGVLLGILGDRLGRKKVLLYTLILMGVASFLIGLLPTYASIGLWAPGLLVLLRFLQGFALGGEVDGRATADDGTRARRSARLLRILDQRRGAGGTSSRERNVVSDCGDDDLRSIHELRLANPVPDEYFAGLARRLYSPQGGRNAGVSAHAGATEDS